MARQKKVLSSQEKAKRDLKIAESVYYTIGGFFLLVGFVFSILGVILLNPPQENFASSPLYLAEQAFFKAINWNTTFLNAGALLMVLSIIYFMIVFYIFSRKGDDLAKREHLKSHRQREIVFPQQAAMEAAAEQVDDNKVNE